MAGRVSMATKAERVEAIGSVSGGQACRAAEDPRRVCRGHRYHRKRAIRLRGRKSSGKGSTAKRPALQRRRARGADRVLGGLGTLGYPVSTGLRLWL